MIVVGQFARFQETHRHLQEAEAHQRGAEGNGAINPVSYTHLDVYKRQVPRLWRLSSGEMSLLRR